MYIAFSIKKSLINGVFIGSAIALLFKQIRPIAGPLLLVCLFFLWALRCKRPLESGVYAEQGRPEPDASRTITIADAMPLEELARLLGWNPIRVIDELMSMDIFVTLKDNLLYDTVATLAAKHGIQVTRKGAEKTDDSGL
jgi:hypothetical protein